MVKNFKAGDVCWFFEPLSPRKLEKCSYCLMLKIEKSDLEGFERCVLFWSDGKILKTLLNQTQFVSFGKMFNDKNT
jgi:hypothetical protein